MIMAVLIMCVVAVLFGGLCSKLLTLPLALVCAAIGGYFLGPYVYYFVLNA